MRLSLTVSEIDQFSVIGVLRVPEIGCLGVGCRGGAVTDDDDGVLPERHAKGDKRREGER